MTLWGGRFRDGPGRELWEFTADPVDRRLLLDDVTGSLAHVSMLERVGLLEADEAASLAQGLRQVRKEAEEGVFEFTEGDEDVHTSVERRLGELVGEVAGKLHTGRSRNDQVTLDLRLYLRRGATERIAQIDGLVRVLAGRAAGVADVIVPTYTHLQQAQYVSLGHHLLAYAWMLLRDAARLESCRTRIDVSPLGAGASAGSSLALDPGLVADELGMADVFTNSLDAVASRDYAAEYAFCCAQAMAHLSRLAEELVLWSTTEFGWAEYRDRDTTGSSALPHKKNPDAAELVRGKAAAVAGDAATLLAVQKGLPLAYNRDLQEDKRAVFHADDSLAGSLAVITTMIDGAVFSPPKPGPWVGSLDVAEALVGRGIPFREAHRAVGRLVAALVAAGRTPADATAEDLAAADERFVPGDLDVVHGRRRHTSPGGGDPASVTGQIAAIAEILGRRGSDRP